MNILLLLQYRFIRGPKGIRKLARAREHSLEMIEEFLNYNNKANVCHLFSHDIIFFGQSALKHKIWSLQNNGLKVINTFFGKAMCV